MSSAANRMKLSEAILALIEQKRAETADPFLGEDVESFLIDAQFIELANEILQNTGALDPWILHRRKGDN